MCMQCESLLAQGIQYKPQVQTRGSLSHLAGCASAGILSSCHPADSGLASAPLAILLTLPEQPGISLTVLWLLPGLSPPSGSIWRLCAWPPATHCMQLGPPLQLTSCGILALGRGP